MFCTSYCISCNTRREVPDILIVHLKWYNEWERLAAMLYQISPDIISLFWFFTGSGTAYIIMHIWEIRCTYIRLSLFIIIVLPSTGIKFPGYILGQILILIMVMKYIAEKKWFSRVSAGSRHVKDFIIASWISYNLQPQKRRGIAE